MKKKYPIFYLLEIPVEILLYGIAVGLGVRADVYLFGGGAQLDNGERAFPLVTVIVLVIATILLILAIIASIVNFIRHTVKKHKKKKAAAATLEKIK